MNYGLWAVVALCITDMVLFTIIFLNAQNGWSKERARLLDRIQAHSLGEYKAFVADDAPPEEKKPPIMEPDLL